MPELPEVETVMRGLAPAMTGARFEAVETRRADLRFPLPERFRERLEGVRIEKLERRAKYILVRLESGEVLTMHLGMTGRFTVEARSPDKAGVHGRMGTFYHEAVPQDAGAQAAHDHVVFVMSSGHRITYNDARRFGYMTLLSADAMGEHPHFKGLGIEPLGPELTPAYLARRAAGRACDLKAFLLDQRHIAGLGNIYVCEALWRAGVAPRRAARYLADAKGRPTQRADRLVPVIRAVLEEAIEAGGSTLRDYRHADGALGYFQHAFAVYDREGEACRTPGCAGTIRRIVQAGRSTFYCPACQR